MSEPVEPCPTCPEGWRPLDKEHCADCYEGKIERLRKALAFYADPKRYMGPNQRNEFSDPFSPGPYLQDVTRDGGEIARRAIR